MIIMGFSSLLNSSKFVISLNVGGSWFQTVSDDMLKDHAAKVLHLVKGTISLVLSIEDLRSLGGGVKVSRSFKYCGAVP